MVAEIKEKYKVTIAKSNKKSKKTVNTFKVRKNENSSIVTVPDEVEEDGFYFMVQGFLEIVGPRIL